MDVAHAFRLQAAACEKMGSNLYARLLTTATESLEAEGGVHAVVNQWDRNAMNDAVPLRLLAGVHRLALRGEAPELARHYPSCGGTPTWPQCGEAFLNTVEANVAALRVDMLDPPQTNEVGRSAVLLGGLLEIARITKTPIRLLEYGASAGLNLRLDAYRYELGETTWGDPTSPVVITTPWNGVRPDTDRTLDIVQRGGCDAAPINVADDTQAIRLLSFVWPDQTERFARTQRAIELVRTAPVPLDRADGAAWLTEQLSTGHEGVVTVVIHSAVTQYLHPSTRREVDAAIRAAAAATTRTAPLARLSFEPGRKYFALRLRLWPHDLDVVLADAHPHGSWATWFIGSTPR